MELYPNPVNDKLTLEVTTDKEETINYSIYDSFGRLLIEKNSSVTTGISQLHIDVSNLNKGVYMIRILKEGTLEGKMFVKY